MISGDGAWLVFREGANGSVRGGRDIRAQRLTGDTTTIPLIVTPFDEDAIALSPDSKWIAYQSDETGTTELFVRSFPNIDGFKRQVSNGGGAAPVWSRNGRELFFLSGSKDMMAAKVTAGTSPTVGTATVLFHVPDDLLKVEYLYYTPWDVMPDGRFIMARMVKTGEPGRSVVIVAENWLTELKARLKR
jgi:Tol biopolymer transport system component